MPDCLPAVTTMSPSVDDLVLVDSVEEQEVLRALAVLDDADRARAVVLRGDGGSRVGEQGDERRVAESLRDLSDEAAIGDDGVVDPDPVVAAGRDHHRLVELAHRIGDDLRGDHGVGEVLVGAEALDLQQTAIRVALLDRLGGLDRLLGQIFDLLAELLVLALRVEDVGRPAVDVLERTRDTVGGDLERPEGARPGALGVVQPAVR